MSAPTLDIYVLLFALGIGCLCVTLFLEDSAYDHLDKKVFFFGSLVILFTLGSLTWLRP